MSISLIISTYNWPTALKRVLESLRNQTVQPDQILVADDGSTEDTRELVQQFPEVQHVWHPDQGFRLAEIRNLALKQATGDWVVFLDGDCLCPPRFVEQQLRLAQSDKILAGNRRLLDRVQSQKILESGYDHGRFVDAHGAKKLDVWPGSFYRDLSPKRWQKVRGCNIGIARDKALAIGGFDEAYQGWGKEDSDFAARAINHGVSVRLGQHAVTVLHLYHAEADRSGLNQNQARLDAVLNSDRYLPERSMLVS